MHPRSCTDNHYYYCTKWGLMQSYVPGDITEGPIMSVRKWRIQRIDDIRCACCVVAESLSHLDH